MASPGQRRGTCGHAMALFDSHTKCARCREKGVGSDACVEKKPAQFVMVSHKNRSCNCPPQSTGYGKNFRRRPTLPPMSIHLKSLFWGRSRVRARLLVIEVKPLVKRVKSPLTSPP